jgi:hypothetical protein
MRHPIGLRMRRSQNGKGQGEQGISGQNRHRLPKFDVASRPTTTKIIVVNRGQVVVDQAEGVNQFERATGI